MVCPLIAAGSAALLQSCPVAHRIELHFCGVMLTVARPLVPPAVAIAPALLAAPLNAVTVMDPSKAAARVAATRVLVSLAGAKACHISAVPQVAFERPTSAQLTPPPEMPVTFWFGFGGPSAETKASNNSFGPAVLKRGEAVERVSSRPSDAVALAVRTGTPILADEEVLAAAGQVPEEQPNESDAEELVDEFRAFIENISPDDFAS